MPGDTVFVAYVFYNVAGYRTQMQVVYAGLDRNTALKNIDTFVYRSNYENSIGYLEQWYKGHLSHDTEIFSR